MDFYSIPIRYNCYTTKKITIRIKERGAYLAITYTIYNQNSPFKRKNKNPANPKLRSQAGIFFFFVFEESSKGYENFEGQI